MARFNHIDGYYINAEHVRFIKEISGEAEGPKDSCVIYFAGSEETVYLHRHTAASVVGILSNKP